MAKTDSLDMAESSERSVQSDKPRMRKTKRLIPDRALEVLEDAVNECQKNGIVASTGTFFENGVQGVVIILANVEIGDDKHLYLIASTGNP